MAALTPTALLREEILARVPATLLANRDDGEIARLLSEGRTQVISLAGGVGTVLRELGPARGGEVLTALESLGASMPAARWALELLRTANADFGGSETRDFIDQLIVGGVLTGEEGDKLKSVAVVPAPVTATQVAAALAGYIHG